MVSANGSGLGVVGIFEKRLPTTEAQLLTKSKNKILMLYNESQAGTIADSSTQPMSQGQAPITPNPMLAEAFSVRPILFSGEMIRAIIEGRKTQTRRIVKGMGLVWLKPDMFTPEFVANPENNMCPYGKVGDILWVRETWQYVDFCGDDNRYVYRATDPDWETTEQWKWKPSIFMPKNACRIFLRITDIKIERLQEIGEADAIDEGVNCNNVSGDWEHTPSAEYEKLWIKINGQKSWDENPFVWVISFERAECPQGFCLLVN